MSDTPPTPPNDAVMSEVKDRLNTLEAKIREDERSRCAIFTLESVIALARTITDKSSPEFINGIDRACQLLQAHAEDLMRWDGVLDLDWDKLETQLTATQKQGEA